MAPLVYDHHCAGLSRGVPLPDSAAGSILIAQAIANRRQILNLSQTHI